MNRWLAIAVFVFAALTAQAVVQASPRQQAMGSVPSGVPAQTGWFISSNSFSSSLINDVCQDGDGFIWVATDYGLNKFDGYRFTSYLHHSSNTTSLVSNVVGCLYCSADGRLWIGTSKGLDCYERPRVGGSDPAVNARDYFTHCSFADGAKPRVTKMLSLPDGRLIVCTSGYHGFYCLEGDRLVPWNEPDTSMHFVNSVLVDAQERLWQCGFGSEISMKDRDGLHKMSSQLGFVVDFALHGDEVLIVCLHGIHSYHDGRLQVADIDMGAMGTNVIFRKVFTDSQGNIYLGTRGDGLFRIARNSRKMERVSVTAEGIDLNTAKVWAINEDSKGNIWLGCQSKGLLMLQNQPSPFLSWNFASQGINISSTITSACEGEKGMTWCTVQGNGVFGFDSLGHVVSRPPAPASAECIYRSAEKRYWVGTGNALYDYDPMTGLSKKCLDFDCDKMNVMADDGQNLYVSVFSKGFFQYDPKTGQSRHFCSEQKDSLHGWLCNNWITAMACDRKGRLWMATSSGVSCYDTQHDTFRSLGWHNLLNGVLCYAVCVLRSGDIAIGTEQGVYSYHPGDEKPQPIGDGQADLVVGSIVEAENSGLWCATSMGIWHWDATKQQFFGHVNGNGLTAKEYINGVGMQTADGRICFATNEGLTVFSPQQVSNSRSDMPAVRLTNFLVADKPLLPDGAPDHFRISYLDNALALEFSLMDYNYPGSIVYEYRIGDSEWVRNAEGQNSIHLSRLQPGSYQIEVRAVSSGIYSPVTTLTVEVTPPWFRSTMAYLFYIVGLVGLIGLIGLIWRRRTQQQLEEEKMRFLINATHDIRSPLTLILGAVKKLKIENEKLKMSQGDANTPSLAYNFQAPTEAIDRNAQRLMLLVNQILDERRIDKNQLQLHCRETNLVSFISAICKLYQFNASQRNIAFTFEHDKDHVLAWIDRANFDKVLSNLLSNAFKYSYDGGEVRVVLADRDRDVEIRVEDNGMGFRNEDLSRLFDRFYQGSNADSMGMQGTGIGLNLCKNIVTMHGGQIRAEHRSNGQQGACFIVSLHKGNAHLKPEQIVTDTPAREVLSERGNQHRKYRILIVDDDQEIADYIDAELGDKYCFDYAANGREALKMLLTAATQGQPKDDSQETERNANNRPYDIVISDVMMPEMDGITLLRHIKKNPNISQLPVIMLTSKAAVEHKLEGLKSGADAYIAKPFNMEELHIQIDNLIDNVRRLRGKFSGALQQEERVENIEVKGNDDALMERIMRSVNTHLADPEFNVDALAADVGISRAQLHRKMKEITGVATGRFLRNIRMEQAARLLREGKVNVSQVADSVGYADQAHFSTAFKQHFGVSPTEFMESKTN